MRPHRRFLFGPRPPGVLLAWAAAATCATAQALGLGSVVQQSSLGQPLRLVVEVVAAPEEELLPECFRLAPAAREPDGVPQIRAGRVALERSPAGAQLVVAHPRAVNEPIVRIALQAGCEQPVRRDYTLLMDPPAIALPAPAPVAASAAPAAVTANAGVAARPASSPPRAAGGSPAAGKTTDRARAAPRRAPARAVAAQGSRAAARAAAAAPGAKPPARSAGAKRSPRLKLSGVPNAAAAAPSAAARARSETLAQMELVRALEAETVVLRQRVAELSSMVERMQQEERAATAARPVAEEAARASPPALATRAGDANWPILAAMIGLAGLIAGGLLWRRRRASAPGSGWSGADVPAGNLGAPARLEPVAGSFPKARTGRPPALPPAGPSPPGRTRASGRNDAAQAVAVSELSQITEEARVYLALGHADRAMAVLREHIEAQPSLMPAAWLMLLDLYRDHGRKQEFSRLGELFHRQFNVQTPQWDGVSEDVQRDQGLEAFAHIVARVTELWGTPDCRSYLERLLYDNRQGRRTGFSLTAYGEILFLRQLLELLLADPDRDAVEEARLRAAWAAAQQTPPREAAPAAPDRPPPKPVAGPDTQAREVPPLRVPLLLDLELDLDRVVGSGPPLCRLETEHPGLLHELTLAWGRPAAATLLHDVLTGIRSIAPALSAEAVAELTLLRSLVEPPLAPGPRRR